MSRRGSAPRLSRLELRVMDVLWARGSASVREVQEALPHEPAYTTVQTTRYRLEAKGILRRAGKIGNALVFDVDAPVVRDGAGRCRRTPGARTPPGAGAHARRGLVVRVAAVPRAPGGVRRARQRARRVDGAGGARSHAPCLRTGAHGGRTRSRGGGGGRQPAGRVA